MFIIPIKVVISLAAVLWAGIRGLGAILAGLLLADFVTGAFHWFEDRYGNPKWPIIGGVIRANQEHHHTPRSFLAGTFISRNLTVFILAAIFMAAFWAVGWLNLFTGSAVVFGAFANEIHRFAHRSPSENGKVITAVQKTGLLQSFQHHAQHHRKGKDTHYCVMTNFLNPVLEKVQFYQTIEKLIFELTGRQPRLDESVNPKYRKTVTGFKQAEILTVS